MKGLRALGLKGDWVLSTVEGTVSDGGTEAELPRQDDAPISAEIVTLDDGRALRLRGAFFGPEGRLVRMADEAALDGHPLGLFLEGSDIPCPPGVVATLVGLDSHGDPGGTLAFGAILQVTEAEDLIQGVASVHQMGTGRTETRRFTLSR